MSEFADPERFSELDYARARAARWGEVLRESGWHGAPNVNCYRETPYLVERTDPAFDYRKHDSQSREIQAAIVDKYYRALVAKYPVAAEAMWLQFAARQPGTWKPLRQKDKMKQWNKRVGCKKTQFYYWLSFALDGLSLYLVEVTG